MNMQNPGRIVLITGAGGGLGRATAQAFAQAGYLVVAVDLSLESAEATVATLTESSAKNKHRALSADISSEDSVVALFKSVETETGAVSVLLNFAGVMISQAGKRQSIISTDLADWDRTFSVNTRGSFICIREMLRHRNERPMPGATIVNISSSAAQLGGYNGSAAYISSKGAILSLTKIAAREAAAMGVTVNCIAPGVIDTQMLRSVMKPEQDEAYCANVPLKRIGDAGDIAAAALFLASDGASYITGSCIDVNGGIRMQ